MRGAHHLLVEQRDVLEERQQIDLLLVLHAEEVVIDLPGDREHGRAVEFGVVQAIQKMNGPGSRRGDAHAQPARVLGVRTGHECRRFFVPYVDEADARPAHAQRLHEAIDAVTGEAEDRVDLPVEQSVN